MINVTNRLTPVLYNVTFSYPHQGSSFLIIIIVHIKFCADVNTTACGLAPKHYIGSYSFAMFHTHIKVTTHMHGVFTGM